VTTILADNATADTAFKKFEPAFIFTTYLRFIARQARPIPDTFAVLTAFAIQARSRVNFYLLQLKPWPYGQYIVFITVNRALAPSPRIGGLPFELWTRPYRPASAEQHGYVVPGREDHEHQNQRHADAECDLLRPGPDRSAPDSLHRIEHQMAAIKY